MRGVAFFGSVRVPRYRHVARVQFNQREPLPAPSVRETHAGWLSAHIAH